MISSILSIILSLKLLCAADNSAVLQTIRTFVNTNDPANLALCLQDQPLLSSSEIPSLLSETLRERKLDCLEVLLRKTSFGLISEFMTAEIERLCDLPCIEQVKKGRAKVLHLCFSADVTRASVKTLVPNEDTSFEADENELATCKDPLTTTLVYHAVKYGHSNVLKYFKNYVTVNEVKTDSVIQYRSTSPSLFSYISFPELLKTCVILALQRYTSCPVYGAENKSFLACIKVLFDWGSDHIIDMNFFQELIDIIKSAAQISSEPGEIFMLCQKLGEFSN
jgi:hypothetical protein